MHPRLHYSFITLSILLSGCNVEVFVTGDGTVTSTTPDQALCNTAPACFSVPNGNAITLKASPKDGFLFAGWGGDCAETQGSECTLNVGSDKQVQATFHRLDYAQIKPLMQPGTAYYFTAPWPNDAYSLDSDGTIDVNAFPLSKSGKLDTQIRKLAAEQRGFATNGGVYFQFDQPDIKPLWQDYLDNFVAANPSPSVGFFLNIDIDSPQYGEYTPAVPRLYKNTEKDGGLEQEGLLLLSVAPGFALKPETTYAAVLLKFEGAAGGLAASDGLQALSQPYTPALGYSETLFSALSEQKSAVDAALTLSGIASPADLAAFTAFTTQDPQALDKQIGATIQALSDADLLASVESLSLAEDCNEGYYQGYSAQYIIKTHLPDFVTGGGLHLLGGGKIELAEGKAVIQGSEVTDLLLSVPCDAPAADHPYPFITHALGTAEGWRANLGWVYTENFTYYSFARNAIQLTLNAPYVDERRPEAFDDAQSFFDQWGIDIPLDDLIFALTDLNFVNLEAARSQHLQYGADLHYVSRLAKLLPKIVEQQDQAGIVPSWVAQTPTSYTLSGGSLGGLAVMHALAQGAQADIVTTHQVPRPNYIHVESIFETISIYSYEIENFVRSFTGIKGNDLAQPNLQWLQTLLEPLDIANYVDLLDNKPLVWSLAPYGDSLHSGVSGFSMITALQRADSLVAATEDDYYGWNASIMKDWYTGDIFNFNDRQDAHLYGNRFVIGTDYYDSYSVMLCFPSALALHPDDFGLWLNTVTNEWYNPPCKETETSESFATRSIKR